MMDGRSILPAVYVTTWLGFARASILERPEVWAYTAPGTFNEAVWETYKPGLPFYTDGFVNASHQATDYRLQR